MVEYRADRETTMDGRLRGSAGGVVAVIVVVFTLFVGGLFATDFWSESVTAKEPPPQVIVTAAGGQLPKIDVMSKDVVVGTEKTAVELSTASLK